MNPNDFAFMMYAFEQEGVINSHEGRVQRAIKNVQNGYCVDMALADAGLAREELSDYDINRILNATR